MADKEGHVLPVWFTFVMKDGDRFPYAQYLSESEPESGVPEPNFDEITKVPIIQWPSSPEPSELEESDTQAQPPDSDDKGNAEWWIWICHPVTSRPYE
jgi:hypothetical protein